MNLALMAKLGWRLILEGDSLWARILISKYVRGEIYLDKITKKHGSSNAWRGISSATDLLKRGARIIAYNNQNTLFWRDSWLGDFLLINLAIREIYFIESFKKVSDYWDPIRGWMWENLTGLLPTYIKDTLSKVLLRQNADAQDRLCWNSTPNGLFSVKSAYSLSL